MPDRMSKDMAYIYISQRRFEDISDRMPEKGRRYTRYKHAR
jgi:hypothetical protein